MTIINWPANNNHFQTSGNLASYRQKYGFSDKNSDTMDVLGGINSLVSSIGEFSSIKKGLIPTLSGSQVRLSQGSFIHNSNADHSVFEQPFFKSQVSGTLYNEFRSSPDSKSSLITVGRIYDEPIQSGSDLALHLLHKVETATVVDPTYGSLTTAAPEVYTAADANRSAVSLHLAPSGRTIPVSSSGSTYTDYLVSYTPMPVIDWVAIPGDTYAMHPTTLCITDQYTTMLNINTSSTPFAIADIGKMVQFAGDTTTVALRGQKRRIVRFISTTSVEVDTPFTTNPSTADSFKVFDGDAQFPALSARVDVFGVRKKTYPIKKIISTVSVDGTPTTSDSVVARYNTTFELVVLEDVKFLGSGVYEAIDTSQTPLSKFDFIPLGMAFVGTSGVTSITSAKPWVTMFRERKLSENNMVPNGNFSVWDSGLPVTWEKTHATGYAMSQSSDTKFGGSALQIIRSNGVSKAIAFKGTLAELSLQCGDTLLLSGWGKVLSGTTNIKFRVVLTNQSDNSGILIQEVLGTSFANRAEYENIDCAFTIPINNDSITKATYIFCFIDVSANSTVLIDGVSGAKISSSRSDKPAFISSVGNTQVIDSNLVISKDITVQGNVKGVLTSNSNAYINNGVVGSEATVKVIRANNNGRSIGIESIMATQGTRNAFVDLVAGAKEWSVITSIGNDVYAGVQGGSIWKSTNGGAFVDLVTGNKIWQGLTSIGNDVYAAVYGGSIWKSTNGGAFVDLVAGDKLWRGLTSVGNDIYACVYEGSIWKSTNGGAFVDLVAGNKIWSGMTSIGNDVYAGVYDGSIWKSTNGGAFVDLVAGNKMWSGLTSVGNDIYAAVQFGSIWKSTNGGAFVDLVAGNKVWTGMTSIGNDVYACVYSSSIWKSSYTGIVKITGDTAIAGALTVTGAIKDKSGFVMPVGTIIAYGGIAAPEGWAMCDGASKLRGTSIADTYFALFTVIGTAFGAADLTHFNVPDMRGRFLRGADDPDGTGTNYTAAGRDPDAGSRSVMNFGGNAGNAVGSIQGDAMQGHRHSNTWNQNSAIYGNGGTAFTSTGTSGDPVSDGTNGTPRISSENRPINAYVNYIIKY